MSAPETAQPRWEAAVDTACTVCRSEDANPAFLVDGHRIVRCVRCRHLYVSPRPAMTEVHAIYGESYFENPAFQTGNNDEHFGYCDYLGDAANTRIRFRQVLRRIESYQPGGRLLDVGCGPGVFVDTAIERGWEAWGVDLNASAVKWAREHVSDTIHLGTISDLDLPPESVDCVTMLDVIEHFGDPRADLLAAARALRPGGVIAIVTPDAGAVVPRLLGSKWLEMKRAPEHLHFFTAGTLAGVLSASGFDAIEWHSFGKVGSVRTMLAEFRFYSTRVVGGIERILDGTRLGDAVLDVDPRTKLCMYARKVRDPLPIDEWVDPGPFRMRRSVCGDLGRVGVHRVHDR